MKTMKLGTLAITGTGPVTSEVCDVDKYSVFPIAVRSVEVEELCQMTLHFLVLDVDLSYGGNVAQEQSRLQSQPQHLRHSQTGLSSALPPVVLTNHSVTAVNFRRARLPSAEFGRTGNY